MASKPIVLKIDKVQTTASTVVDFDQIQPNLDNAVSALKGTASVNYDTLGKLETAIIGNDADITNLQTSLSANSTDISTLQGAVSTNTTDIGNIQADYATQGYVTNEVNTLRSDILGGASTAYDTLQEIEAYLGNNDTDITNIVNTMATKAPLPASATVAGEVLTWTGTAFFNDPQPITDLNALISTNASDIATLQTNQGILTNALNANTANIASNTTDIATLNAGLSTAQTDILANTADITTNAGDISTLQTDLVTANTAITSNSARLTVNEGNITTLQTDVATNTAGITQNLNDIATLQSDLSSTNSNVTTLQSDVSTNSADISTLQSDVSSLTSTVSTHTSNFTTVTNSLNTKAPVPPTQTNAGDFLYFDGTSFQYGTPSGGSGGSSTSVSGTGGILIGYQYINSSTPESFSANGYSTAILELTTTGANSVFCFSFNGTVVINGTADVNVHFRTKDPAVGTWSNWIDTTCAYRKYQNDSWGVLKESAHPLIGIHRPTDHVEYPTLPSGWSIQYGVSVEVSAGTIYFPKEGFGINASLMELAA